MFGHLQSRVVAFTRGLARSLPKLARELGRIADQPRRASGVLCHVEDVASRHALAELAAVALRRGGARRRCAEHVRDRARTLATAGIVPLGRVMDPAQVDEITRFIDPFRCRDVYRSGLGAFVVKAPHPDANVGAYDGAVVVDAPHLLRIANDPAILAIVEAFLGAKPTLSGLDLIWSFPGKAARGSQLFHRDMDDLRFCKLFVYLTDVDHDGGPHVFVLGSPSVNRCTKKGRHPDSEVREAFGTTATTSVCGLRGEAFLANTFGLHKGLVPRERPRLVFIAEYSLFPIANRDYAALVRPQLARQLDAYVNRLYVRAG